MKMCQQGPPKYYSLLQRATVLSLSICCPAVLSDCTFAATGNKVFVVASKAGVDGVEALGHTLVFPHQHTVLEVPQVHSLQKIVEE